MVNVEELLKLPKGSKTGVFCKECGCEMIVREGYDKFLGCSAYPKCKHIMQFVIDRGGLDMGTANISHPHLSRLFMERADWIGDMYGDQSNHGSQETEFFDELRMCFDK